MYDENSGNDYKPASIGSLLNKIILLSPAYILFVKPINTMSSKNQEQYFIAIIPPEPLANELFKLKEYFKSQYESKASLNSPAHITLHMPFRYNPKKEDLMQRKLQDFAQKQTSFQVELDGFSAFTPRVIYTAVTPNKALIETQKGVGEVCRKDLKLHNANYKSQAYHPHITLAFRDLKKQNFQLAWEEFKDKEFHASFEVSSFHLLKHDGKKWHSFHEFPLGI